MDDALTLTYLFAALPSNTAIKAKMGAKAKTLAAAWGAYCSTAGCITKSFISVKGVYLEATIRDVPIRWVVPHSFTQFMPEDVDYKVMATFFEFYETLMNFVLFKLYSDLGVRYPLPEIEGGEEVKGSTTSILGANLRSLINAMNHSDGAITNVISETLEEDDATEKSSAKKSTEEKKKDRKLMKSVVSALDNIEEDDDDEDEKDVDVAGPLKAALETLAEDKARSSIPSGLTKLDDEAVKRRRLFAGLTFFLSREVPRGYLELLSLAYGANVGWEGANSPISAKDPSITHHIVDRPKLLSSYDSLPKSREFIQPQWILDCTNFMFLLPIIKYGVGKPLPPHLSPWVDNEEEGYTPSYAIEINKLKNGEEPTEEVEEEEPVDVNAIEAEMQKGVEESEDDDDDDEDDDTDDKDKKKIKKARAAKIRERDEKEAHELAKSMMGRKAAHLYGRMQHGIDKKQAKVDGLESRRREAKHTKEKDESGKSFGKQKVERLKKERRRVEDEYKPALIGGTMKKSKMKR